MLRGAHINPYGRYPFGLWACLLALSAGGCGLSGGSVPIGRPGRVAGTVVRAFAPGTGVAGAVVSIQDAAGRMHTAAADGAGAFAVEGVASGNARISATAGPAELASVSARIDPDVTTSVLLSLTPANGAGVPSSISLPLPTDTLSLEAGESQGLALPSQGGTTAYLPSIVVEGGIGTIGPDGVFHATGSGSGSIHVFAGGAEAILPVDVVPAAAEVP